MKILRIGAMVVGTAAAIALVASGVGAPIGAGILGASWSTIAAGAALVSTVTQMAAPRGSPGGSSTDFRADPQAGIPYAIGRTATGGNIVHHDSFGNDRKYQAFVTVLSYGPIQETESFKADRETVTFEGSGAATAGTYYGQGGGNDTMMWRRTQLGATPEASYLAPFNGTLPGWSSSYKLSGLAADLWELRYDVKGKKNYNNGVPKPLRIIKGVKVYDPRLDSTYPGGSGSCRPLIESTYVYSENPWLHALTWALGRWQNGKRVMGIGMPAAGINIAAYVEAANIADANAWKAGGVIYSTDDKWDRLKAMAQAGGGLPIRLAAQLSCIVNTPRVSLATIASADLVGEGVISGTQPRRARINGIVPRYTSEAHDWEVVSADAVRVSAYVVTDAGERTKELDLPLVQNVSQAAQLARYEIENARERGPIVLPLKTKWIGYKPGDCVTVNIPEMGLAAQPCIIINRTLDPSSAVVTLELRTETAAKHSGSLAQPGAAPPAPVITVPDYSAIPAPTLGSWAVTATSINSGGVILPALVITGAVDNDTAEAIIFEYRIAGDLVWNPTSPEIPTATRKEILGVNPSTDYEVAVSYRVRGHISAKLVLSTATTAGSPYVVPGGLSGYLPLSGGTLTNDLILNFDVADFGPPTDGVRSLGTRMVLYPRVHLGTADYAVGIDSFTLWQGVPVNSASYYFKWYAGEDEIMSLNPSSGLHVIGQVRGDALRLDLTPSAAAAVPSTHKVPVSLNGTTYYLLATT